MKILNQSKNTLLAENAELADTFTKRLTGLLGRKGLREGQGLVLCPSNSIHSIFMLFSFDCIFLDSEDRVVAVTPDFKPYRVSPIYFSARTTLELPLGVIAASKTEVGDKVVLLP